MLAMLAAIAEMERDSLVERTQSGLARTKAEGKTLGRPARTTDEQGATMISRFKTGESISALARASCAPNVHRSYFAPAGRRFRPMKIRKLFTREQIYDSASRGLECSDPCAAERFD